MGLLAPPPHRRIDTVFVELFSWTRPLSISLELELALQRSMNPFLHRQPMLELDLLGIPR